MKISILCSDSNHPVNKYLVDWINIESKFHKIDLVYKKSDLKGGDLLFLISCREILLPKDRLNYSASLLIHASDLPLGRGWSPHIWEISAGARYITLSLLEVEDKIDSGRIWKKIRVSIPKSALWDEINQIIFSAEVELMRFAVKSFNSVEPEIQSSDIEPSYFRLRTPQDSRIDPEKTIGEQFDLMRVCDPFRFPAFFEYRGCKYKIKLERVDDE